MNVDFGEDDVSIRERGGSLRVVLTYRRQIHGVNISVQVVPMTLTQFTATGTPLPQGVSLADDPAEEGNQSSVPTSVLWGEYGQPQKCLWSDIHRCNSSK